jgi:adenosine deaminase
VVDLNIPVEICPTSNVAACPSCTGVVKFLPHLMKFVEAKANICICCDDTMLFSTHHSTEFFEYMNAVEADSKDCKEMVLRNVDAIFDDSVKEWLKEKIEQYNV